MAQRRARNRSSSEGALLCSKGGNCLFVDRQRETAAWAQLVWVSAPGCDSETWVVRVYDGISEFLNGRYGSEATGRSTTQEHAFLQRVSILIDNYCLAKCIAEPLVRQCAVACCFGLSSLHPTGIGSRHLPVSPKLRLRPWAALSKDASNRPPGVPQSRASCLIASGRALTTLGTLSARLGSLPNSHKCFFARSNLRQT